MNEIPLYFKSKHNSRYTYIYFSVGRRKLRGAELNAAFRLLSEQKI